MGYSVSVAFVKARKNRSSRPSRVRKILPMIKLRFFTFVVFFSLLFREPA